MKPRTLGDIRRGFRVYKVSLYAVVFCSNANLNWECWFEVELEDTVGVGLTTNLVGDSLMKSKLLVISLQIQCIKLICTF